MDAQFWQKYYDEKHTPWDIGAPSTPLKEYIDQLNDKTISILVPGCGSGYEVIYLAQQGFTNVTAMDLVDDAFDKIRKQAPTVKCLVADVFEHTGSYDLILEQTLFCAIDPALRDQYVAKAADLLNPGGKFVGVLFNRSFEGGPPFGGSLEEYRDYFDKYFSEYSMEDCYNSIGPRKRTEVFVIAKK